MNLYIFKKTLAIGQLDTCATTADPDINISTNINTITYTKEKKLNSNSRAIGVEDRWSKRKTYNSLQVEEKLKLKNKIKLIENIRNMEICSAIVL